MLVLNESNTNETNVAMVMDNLNEYLIGTDKLADRLAVLSMMGRDADGFGIKSVHYIDRNKIAMNLEFLEATGSDLQAVLTINDFSIDFYLEYKDGDEYSFTLVNDKNENTFEEKAVSHIVTTLAQLN